METCRRREVLADGASSALFHVAYDNTRHNLESLSESKLRQVIEGYRQKDRVSFWCSRYIPSFAGLAGMNALVDIAEEKEIIRRVR